MAFCCLFAWIQLSEFEISFSCCSVFSFHVIRFLNISSEMVKSTESTITSSSSPASSLTSQEKCQVSPFLLIAQGNRGIETTNSANMEVHLKDQTMSAGANMHPSRFVNKRGAYRVTGQ
ncbi:hypothetical protein MLD38_020452 [Melastoma candidum]|uniref:Uncharacterized protein n=1 Tax=Melastoma candidum TaxID=119954 RepID=A0ACB9QD29_9MYRT|nr:hypothetical protein MLD38_020452 [Melastoma candidum]